jgi:AAA family ATP:ADP antiporter
VARAFYVWVSVYNLFVVSVFWSFMADVFSREQGKRLFGLIAAGGSLGAIAGPTLAAWLAQTLDLTLLPLVAAVLLFGAMLAVVTLDHRQQGSGKRDPLHGGVWEGVQLVAGSRFLQGIAVFIWLYTTLATFLYFQQAHLVADAFDDPADRTSLFATIDLLVNTLTIAIQLFLAGRIMQSAGIGKTLAALPLLLAAGFAVLAAAPTIAVLITVQVLRRAGNYGITRPAREVLYTSMSRKARYKAKNFIDTVVYRGGDALAGWLFAGLKAAGLGLGGIALLAVPLAIAWGWIGYKLGQRAETNVKKEANNDA